MYYKMCWIFEGKYGKLTCGGHICSMDANDYFLTLGFPPMDTDKYSFAIFATAISDNEKLNPHYFETAPFEYTITFHNEDGISIAINNVRFGGSLLG